MALNIKNPEVELLAADVAAMCGETKTEAVRRALEERKQRLAFQVARRDRAESLLRFLEREIWPAIPQEIPGRPVDRSVEDDILGYGEDGV